MSTFIDPLILLARAGYPAPQPSPPGVDQALSTGRGILGIGMTALGAMGALQAGVQPGFVFTPIAVSPYR